MTYERRERVNGYLESNQNAFIEKVSEKLRDECVSGHWCVKDVVVCDPAVGESEWAWSALIVGRIRAAVFAAAQQTQRRVNWPVIQITDGFNRRRYADP
jgi:hypothetical protein